MYKHRRTTRQGIFPTAGWLFADLLLALTVIFLAASTVGKPAPPKTLVPTPTPTLAPTPTPTQPPAIQALATTPLTFSVNVDPQQLGDPATIATVKNTVTQALNQAKDSNRKAGFVLTLAGGFDGEFHAHSFNAILKSMTLFQSAVFKDYHNLGNAEQEFDLEIYFFVDVNA